MSDRQLSKRSKRRLRSKVALLVAEQLAARVQQTPSVDTTSGRSPSPSVHTGSTSDRSPSPSVHTGSTSDRSPSPSVHTGSMSDRSPSTSDYDCHMESVGHDSSEVRDSSSEDLCGEGSLDVSGMEECSSASSSISESLSSVSGVESDNDEGQSQQEDTVPLFPHAHVSTEGFEVAFMSLVQRYNLTYASQSDLLKLFSIVLPSPSKVPSSSYVLISKFIDYGKDTVTQHYCGSCMSVLQPGLLCVSSHCSKKGGIERAVFVRVSLAMQLKERFEGRFRTNSMLMLTYYTCS